MSVEIAAAFQEVALAVAMFVCAIYLVVPIVYVAWKAVSALLLATDRGGK